jgi:hypothetical protein
LYCVNIPSTRVCSLYHKNEDYLNLLLFEFLPNNQKYMILAKMVREESWVLKKNTINCVPLRPLPRSIVYLNCTCQEYLISIDKTLIIKYYKFFIVLVCHLKWIQSNFLDDVWLTLIENKVLFLVFKWLCSYVGLNSLILVRKTYIFLHGDSPPN